QCGKQCLTVDSECPDGQRCFADVNPLACGPLPIPNSRCGSAYADANSQCGTQCTRDNDCPSGQFCFLGVGLEACNGLTPPLPPTWGGSTGTATATGGAGSESGSNGNTSQDAGTSSPSSTGASESAGSGKPTANDGTISAGIATATATISTIATSISSTISALSSSPSTSGTATATATPSGLPLLPPCATGCFTAANLFNLPTAELLKNFCSNESGVANSAYKCSLNSCTESSQQSSTVRYINALGDQCTKNGQGTPGWKFTPELESQNSDGSSSGLSGVWIGLIVLFVALFLAIVFAVVYFCCFRGRRRRQKQDVSERRDHYNHVNA
ncbi:hypothetical protein BDR26DRAFT_859810, partial [Obelidium mucronatum]